MSSLIPRLLLTMAGMLARVELPAGDQKSVPLVIKDALVLNESDRSVFVVDGDPSSTLVRSGNSDAGSSKAGTVRKVSVELGVAAGGMIQIRGSVRPGDFVVAIGNERLRDGERVEIMDVIENDDSLIDVESNSIADE